MVADLLIYRTASVHCTNMASFRRLQVKFSLYIYKVFFYVKTVQVFAFLLLAIYATRQHLCTMWPHIRQNAKTSVPAMIFLAHCHPVKFPGTILSEICTF